MSHLVNSQLCNYTYLDIKVFQVMEENYNLNWSIVYKTASYICKKFIFFKHLYRYDPFDIISHTIPLMTRLSKLSQFIHFYFYFHQPSHQLGMVNKWTRPDISKFKIKFMLGKI